MRKIILRVPPRKKNMRNTGQEVSYISVHALVGRISLKESSVKGHESFNVSY